MNKPTCIIILPYFFYLSIFCSDAQVINTMEGKVEFIGLKQWSIEMIKDSLEKYVPNGHGLSGCAGELTTSLHFADASVIRYMDDTSYYTVITLVEPQDRKNTEYKQNLPGSEDIFTDYKTIDTIYNRDFMAFQYSIINYGLYKSGNTDSAISAINRSGTDLKTALRVWAFLTSEKDEKTKTDALWLAEHSPNQVNRAISAAILTNFPNDSQTWWTLMDMLRDNDIFVNTIARLSLKNMSKYTPAKTDWGPCIATLRLLLNGTNLFAYTTVLEALKNTDISPDVANRLLDDNTSFLLIACLAARHDEERKVAHELLKKLSGKDYGTDPILWKQWIGELKYQKDTQVKSSDKGENI
jgi:hypothetical protein